MSEESENIFTKIKIIGTKNINTNRRVSELFKVSTLCDKMNYFQPAISKIFPALSLSLPRFVRFILSILNGYPHDFTISDTSMFSLIGYS